MCGIGGHFGRPTGPDVRVRMMAALANRGPDAQHLTTFAADGTRLPEAAFAPHGLVHARLSIIDPRPEADQPFGTEDGAGRAADLDGLGDVVVLADRDLLGAQPHGVLAAAEVQCQELAIHGQAHLRLDGTCKVGCRGFSTNERRKCHARCRYRAHNQKFASG